MCYENKIVYVYKVKDIEMKEVTELRTREVSEIVICENFYFSHFVPLLFITFYQKK